LVVVLPLTKVSKSIPSHIPIPAAESGLHYDSFVIVEQVRCIAKERFTRRIGHASTAIMDRVSRLLRVILEL
jgi:mRNA-degrading endonuclease toxin of MazEF toxin-antitoxin module